MTCQKKECIENRRILDEILNKLLIMQHKEIARLTSNTSDFDMVAEIKKEMFNKDIAKYVFFVFAFILGFITNDILHKMI